MWEKHNTECAGAAGTTISDVQWELLLSERKTNLTAGRVLPHVKTLTVHKQRSEGVLFPQLFTATSAKIWQRVSLK